MKSKKSQTSKLWERYPHLSIKIKTKGRVDDAKERLGFSSHDQLINYLLDHTSDGHILILNKFREMRDIYCAVDPNNKDMVKLFDFYEKAYQRVLANPTEMHEFLRLLLSYIAGEHRAVMQQKDHKKE